MSEFKHGLGWLPDYPDFRDYTIYQKELGGMLNNLGVTASEDVDLPERVILKDHFTPVEDQGALGSCTAQAAAGLVEYYEDRAYGDHKELSRRFLYKVTRKMLGWTGDTGAYIRTTMGALVLFGAPPEEYWPYDIDKFDAEPSAFCYSYARNFQALKYYRLDAAGTPPECLLGRVKQHMAAGLPAMFGFTVYRSINDAEDDGKIKFPGKGDKAVGGHAIVAAGYDDNIKIPCSHDGGMSIGALRIRNSWGRDWGLGGYGWLPYDYILNDQTADWWSLLASDWVDTGQFGK